MLEWRYWKDCDCFGFVVWYFGSNICRRYRKIIDILSIIGSLRLMRVPSLAVYRRTRRCPLSFCAISVRAEYDGQEATIRRLAAIRTLIVDVISRLRQSFLPFQSPTLLQSMFYFSDLYSVQTGSEKLAILLEYINFRYSGRVTITRTVAIRKFFLLFPVVP